MMNKVIKNATYGLIMCLLTAGCSKSAVEEETDPNPEVNPPASAETIKIVHPGMLHTAADLNFVKGKVDAGLAPWKEGYDKLNSSTHLNLSYAASPTVKLIRGGGSREEPEADNYSNAMRDSHTAYQMGLKWKLTGDDRYAAKGVEILNAWAATCKSISGDSNRSLASGIYGYTFANAAEILRDYSGWKATDFTAYKKWMLDVFYPEALDFLERHHGTCNFHYWTNWDAANMCAVLAIGILTDDANKVNFAISYFKKGVGNGNIDNAVVTVHDVNGEKLGQGQEAGRDQGHATLVISLLSSFCQMAYNSGVDLFAYKDNKFLALCEYTAKYNYADASGIFPYNVPFTTYSNCGTSQVTHTVVSNDGRGVLRPTWELVYNHYAKVKSLNPKYSKMMAEKVRPEGGGSHYGPNSGGYDQLGFGTLLFSK